MSKKKQQTRKEWSTVLAMLVIALGVMAFTQLQIIGVSSALDPHTKISGKMKGLQEVDLEGLKSTAHTVAAVFPMDDFSTAADVSTAMLPTGTPKYGAALGVSFDDPLGSLERLSRMYPALKDQVQRDDPEAFARFMDMASRPLGMSCEFCCGVGPSAIDSKGNSICGCQHNPALLSVALWLTHNTDYSDGQILYEVMRWKTLFFPKDMVGLGTKIMGGDTSVLEEMPGMVGGC